MTHVLLQEGHLWGRKEVAIPISAVDTTVDGTQLKIAKQDVQDLPPVDISHPEVNLSKTLPNGPWRLPPVRLKSKTIDLLANLWPACLPAGGLALARVTGAAVSRPRDTSGRRGLKSAWWRVCG